MVKNSVALEVEHVISSVAWVVPSFASVHVSVTMMCPRWPAVAVDATSAGRHNGSRGCGKRVCVTSGAVRWVLGILRVSRPNKE